MKERIVIVFVAVVIGLVLTTVGYLLYQSLQNSPSTKETAKKIASIFPSATPSLDKSKLYITITDPKPEAITDTRTVKISGSTNPGNTVVISSNEEDVVATPKGDGSFSTSITIDAGANVLVARATDPNGTETSEKQTITFVSEEF